MACQITFIMIIFFSENTNVRHRKTMTKTEQTIQGLWENHPICNIHKVGIPEREERQS